jgi:hypothetical protein
VNSGKQLTAQCSTFLPFCQLRENVCQREIEMSAFDGIAIIYNDPMKKNVYSGYIKYNPHVHDIKRNKKIRRSGTRAIRNQTQHQSSMNKLLPFSIFAAVPGSAVKRTYPKHMNPSTRSNAPGGPDELVPRIPDDPEYAPPI